MRELLSFWCDGLPVAQPRVKATSFGGFTRVYNPSTAKGWKTVVTIAAKGSWKCEPFEGPLCVDLTFWFPRPQSHYKGKAKVLRPSAPIWHTTKPDRDNLDKAVMDALTQAGIWRDDKQVCDGRIRKMYCEPGNEGCQVEISEAVFTP